jgi:hypothetical protein
MWVTYSTRAQKKHTKVLDVLIHYDPLYLFITGILKQNIFTWKKGLTDTSKMEQKIFHITHYLSAKYWLLLELNRLQTMETPVAIYHNMHIIYMHKNKQTQI